MDCNERIVEIVNLIVGSRNLTISFGDPFDGYSDEIYDTLVALGNLSSSQIMFKSDVERKQHHFSLHPRRPKERPERVIIIGGTQEDVDMITICFGDSELIIF